MLSERCFNYVLFRREVLGARTEQHFNRRRPRHRHSYCRTTNNRCALLHAPRRAAHQRCWRYARLSRTRRVNFFCYSYLQQLCVGSIVFSARAEHGAVVYLRQVCSSKNCLQHADVRRRNVRFYCIINKSYVVFVSDKRVGTRALLWPSLHNANSAYSTGNTIFHVVLSAGVAQHIYYRV